MWETEDFMDFDFSNAITLDDGFSYAFDSKRRVWIQYKVGIKTLPTQVQQKVLDIRRLGEVYEHALDGME